jgi:hypothetical protein
MAKSGNYDIPFLDGDQQHYAEPWHGSRINWKPNFEFTDELVYQGYSRGRSAAYFNFSRQNGKTVTMFLKDFEEAIHFMEFGRMKGKFTFVKRGMNYGARRIGD